MAPDEFPELQIEMFCDSSGRLLIALRGDEQNPMISYNDTNLSRAPAGLSPQPIFNDSRAGGAGFVGAGSSNTCGIGHAGSGGCGTPSDASGGRAGATFTNYGGASGSSGNTGSI